MKTLKGMTISMIGLVAAIAAVGCGDAIQGFQTTAQMLGCVIISCGLLATAIVLCALAVSDQEYRKIKQVAHHTNEWRDAR